MAENLGVHWEITSTGAEVYLKDADAARRDAEATEKLRAANGRLEKANASLRAHIDQAKAAQQAQARAAQDATAKAERYTRTQRLVAQIMRQTGASHTAAARAVRVFGTDLDRAEREAAQYARQMDRAEKEVRQLAAAQRAAAGTGLSASLKTLALQAVGAASALTAIYAAIRLIKSTFSTFSDFEARMAGVKAVTQATGAQMAALTAQSRRLGETTVFTATQAAEAQETLARAGFSVAENLSSLPKVLDLAVAGEFDLGRAADITAGLLRGFHLPASQAAMVVDTIAKAANIANIDVGLMADGFKYATPVAEALDISMQDTAAALDVLADNMLKGEQGGAALRTGILSIIDPGQKTAKVLGDLHLTAEQLRTTIEQKGLVAGLRLLTDANADLTDVIALAGKRGGPALQILISNMEALEHKRGLLDNITDEAKRMAAVKLDTFAGDVKELKSAWESLQITMALQQAPGARGLLNILTDVLRNLSGVLVTVADNWRLIFAVIGLSTIKAITMAILAHAAAVRAWALSLGGVATILGLAGAAALYATEAWKNRLAAAIDKAAASTVKFRDEQEKLTDAIKSGNKALIAALITEYTAKAAKSAADLASAESEIADATSRLAEAQAALSEARKKGGTDRQMGLGSEIKNLQSGYSAAKREVDEYASALNRAQQARGDATIEDRAAKSALDALQAALKGIGLKEHRDRIDDVTKKQAQWIAKLAEEIDALRRAAKDNYALGDAQEFGAQAVEEFGDELEIQRKVLAKVSDAERQGTADTLKFRKAIKEYEQALRDAAKAERHRAGKETLKRLKDQIAVEQALLAITSAGPAAVDALSKSLDRERQILEATAKASKRQAAEIEASMRRLFALQDARAVASQVQAIRQEIEETRRLTAARAQGTAAAEAEAAQIQLEKDLRAAAAGGINLQTLALMALIQARAQEAAQARQSGALQNLKDEIELLRLRNRVMREGLGRGLSQSEAQRQGDMAAQVERMTRETGIAREVIKSFVEQQAALNDQFERTVGNLEYASAVLDRIAGIMSQMGGTIGELGSALGGVAQGFQDIRAGAAEGGALGALGAIAGALKMAKSISDLYISLGFAQGQRGTGALGGQLSGDFADLGGQIGSVAGLAFGPIGSAIGALAGSIIGGAIKSGADEFLATILSFGTDLVATVDKVEGGLGPAGDALTSGITDVLSKLEAAIGGEVFVAGVQLKIRDDVVKVFVNGITGAFKGETAIQDAVAFAVSEMLKTADFGAGISDTMQAILRNGFESLDQLEAAVNFGNQIDDMLADPLTRFMNAMNRQARELAATATQLGVPLGTVVAAMEAQAQAALDVSRSAVLAAAGLDPAVDQWKTLKAQVDQVSEESVAALEEQLRQVAEAALGSAEALRTGGSAFDGTSESFDGLMLKVGISGSRADQLRERFEELTRAGAPAEQIVEELTVALQGLDSAQSRQAIERFRSQFLGGLYDQMAELARQAGNNKLAAEFAARAENFRFLALEISTRVTIAAAQAEGLLGEARAAALLAQLDNLAALRAALQAAGVRGGGRGRGEAAPTTIEPTTTDADREAEEAARRAADAASEFADTLALLESRAAGATDTARAYADEQARLLALYREGAVPFGDYVHALELMAQLHLEDIAEDWAGAAQRMRQTDLQAETLALQDRAQQAWADALLAAADNPAAYERAAQAIVEGLTAELHDIGRQALGELGSEFVRLRRSGMATVREIRYLSQHLEEFGLTAEQLRRVVSEGILPGLLDMAIAEAERVGDTKRAIALRQQQADIERRLQLLQISLWQAQLEAAGALDAAARAIIDQLIIDLGRADAGTTPPGTSPWPTIRAQTGTIAATGAGAGDGGSAAVPRSAADIFAELTRDLETPAQRMRRILEEALDAIAASAGTAAEKAEDARLAEERFQRERLRGLMDLREQILGAQQQDQPAAKAVNAAQAAFEAALASGDEDAILQAAQQWLDAVADFPTLLRRAQAMILADLGPIFAGDALSTTPPPPLLGLSPLPPPGQIISAPAPTAASAINLRGLETRLDTLTREVAALRVPLGRTATATETTATLVRPLDRVAVILDRRL